MLHFHPGPAHRLTKKSIKVNQSSDHTRFQRAAMLCAVRHLSSGKAELSCQCTTRSALNPCDIFCGRAYSTVCDFRKRGKESVSVTDCT